MSQPRSASLPSPRPAPRLLDQRHLKNLLLDRPYQIRYTGTIVGVSAALTAGMGALVYHFVREASQVVAVRRLDPADGAAREIERQLLHNDHLLGVALAAFGVMLVLVLTVHGLVATHKVAGPLHKIAGYLHDIREGRLGPIAALRHGDQLRAFYTAFADMHAALVARTRAEALLLEEVAAELDEVGHAQLAERLRALSRSKRASLD